MADKATRRACFGRVGDVPGREGTTGLSGVERAEEETNSRERCCWGTAGLVAGRSDHWFAKSR